jgi:hypothetical protein
VAATATYTTVAEGATLPYTEYQAEAATYNGTLIGPSTTMQMNGGSLQNEMAAESSGREAVELTSGQGVTFTAQHAFNSIVVRYIIPDASGGGGISATLSCYVNGTFNQELALTSAYDWDYGSNMNYTTSGGVNVPGYDKTPGGDAFHLYDETHALLGTNYAAGSTVSLEVGPNDKAGYYVIDFIDLEQAPAALTMPAGFVSITASPYNAVSGGTTDNTAAIQNCITNNSNVWIPAGNFGVLSGSLNVPIERTIEGAGMWYSELSGYYATFNLAGNYDVFSNFYMDGNTTNRDDDSSDNGFNNGGGTGSSITDVWVEHEKCGYWMNSAAGATSNGFNISGCRFRDLYADGVNINQGSVNCVITNNNFRNTGDDSLAEWSQSGYTNSGNMFSYNTIQNPWRADCFALYGGSSNDIENNTCSDTLDQSGIMVEQGFTSTGFSGTNTISNNTLTNAGGYFGGEQYGAIDLWGNQSGLAGAFTISNNLIQSPTYMGVEFNGPNDASGGTFSNLTINNAGTYGVEVESGTSGTATFSTTTVNSPGSGNLLNSGSMTLSGDP